MEYGVGGGGGQRAETLEGWDVGEQVVERTDLGYGEDVSRTRALEYRAGL